jgi:polyhydroxyalkanoate synthesis repressor PhaR
MSEPRVIKKYPNRRLYDTVESRYITLGDIHRLVTNGQEFLVVDKKTQQDITRVILLQVITEREQNGQPLLGREFLLLLIRSYDKPDSIELSARLERAVRGGA